MFHYKKGSSIMMQELAKHIYDNTPHGNNSIFTLVEDVWQPVIVEDLTLISLTWTYIAFLVLLVFNMAINFVITQRTSVGFQTCQSLTTKLIHSFRQQMCPTIFKDWETSALSIDKVKKQIKWELGLKIALFSVVNLLLLLPVVLLKFGIDKRNKVL